MATMKKGKYKHYKRKMYEVLDFAIHTETGEEMVVYKALYETEVNNGGLWTRPLNMFKENITVDGNDVPRFEYVEE
jgi:hypothetical protein